MKLTKKIYANLNERMQDYRLKLDLFLARHGFLDKLSWDDIEVKLIISTGRTGTKFIANFLDKFDKIKSYHEPYPNFLVLGNDFASGKITAEYAQRIIEKDRKLVLKEVINSDLKIYVESNNMLFSLIPIIRHIFTNCRIVHIVRDGRDVVRSGMSRPWYTSEDLLPRIKASDFPDDPYFSKWENMSRFEKVCWWWQKRDKIIYDSVNNYPDSLTIKFEDIFDASDGFTGIKKIVEFFELDIEYESESLIKKVNKTVKYSIPHWKSWVENQKKDFMSIAGEHLKLYGYIGDQQEIW